LDLRSYVLLANYSSTPAASEFDFLMFAKKKKYLGLEAVGLEVPDRKLFLSYGTQSIVDL
jgi:hypothetical protein